MTDRLVAQLPPLPLCRHCFHPERCHYEDCDMAAQPGILPVCDSFELEPLTEVVQ